MTDDRLRALERRFKESGDPADELAWLRERIRTQEQLDWSGFARLAQLDPDLAAEVLLGREVDPRRLDLAACLGHEPSRRLSPGVAPPLSSHERIEALLNVVGSQASVRLTLIAAQVWPDPDPHQARFLGRVTPWVADWLVRGDRELQLPQCPTTEDVFEDLFFMLLIGSDLGEASASMLGGIAVRALWRTPAHPDAAVERAQELPAALERELFPWLLGFEDPLA